MTTTEMTAGTGFDPAKAEAFGGRLMGILQGGLLSLMVDIGHRDGAVRGGGRRAGPRASSWLTEQA